jgi:hypothetical protein
VRAHVVLVACCASIAGCSCAASHEASDASIDAPATGADASGDVGQDARSDDTLWPDAVSADAVSAYDAPSYDAPDACVTQQPGSWTAPPPDPSCPANEWLCAGACTRLGDDGTNCGACGVRCCGGWCYSGVCGVEGPPGIAGCGWSCGPGCVGPTPTNVSVDSANCGYCGHACTAGQRCVNGLCQ